MEISKQYFITLIQVYGPTTAATEEEMERFYQDLSPAVKQFHKADVLLVMGDCKFATRKSAEENCLQCHLRLGCMAGF